MIMRIFKNKDFNKWSKKLNIPDSHLIKSVEEMQNGLYEAKIGAGLYKKRLGYGGRGKSSGARTLLVFKKDEFAIFIYGFQKNEKDNINAEEKSALKELTNVYVRFNEEQFKVAIKNRQLIEVKK
jgi:hypothetical protein